MRLKPTLSLFYLLLMLNIALAQQSDNGNQPIDDQIYHGILPNGLTYYVRKNVSPKKRAVLYLVEKAGSLQEDDDQLGVAHFVEHMAFNGTRNFPKNELVSYLQLSGVKFGADVNAHTGYNNTEYYITLPTDSMLVFNKGLDILNDWAGYLTFDPAEINNERNIILEEERLRMNTANGRLSKQAMPFTYNNSRYALRLPIGTDEIIKNVKPEVLKRFYHDWYRPDKEAIIVVGDFNPRKVVQLIKEKFSSLKNPDNERPITDYPIPAAEGTRVKILTDKETPGTIFSMTVRLRGTKLTTNVEYLERLRAELLTYMLNTRISEIAKQGNPPFLYASTISSPSLGNTDVFNVVISAKPGQLEQSVKTIMTEIERVKKFGFTEAEFKTAKELFVRQRNIAFYNIENHPSVAYAQEYERNFLQDEGIPGLEYEYNLTLNNIDKLPLSEFKGLMEVYTTDQNRVILLEAPEKDAQSLPDEKTLLNWVDHPNKDVSAYQGDVVDESIDQLPGDNLKSGKIDSSKTDNLSGIETLTLSNGAKVILKTTDFAKGQVLFNIFGFGGTSIASNADYTSAALAASLVSKSGLATFNQIELDKMLINKSLGLSLYLDNYVQGIEGGASQSNFENALKLIHLYFTQPRKDSTVWAGIISQRKAALATRDNSPQNVFIDTMQSVLTRHNLRTFKPDAADINKAFSFYKDRFADASNFTFVFVGNLDDIGIRSLIKKYIGSLPSTHSKQTYRDLHADPPPGNITRIINKGIDDKSTVYLVFHGPLIYNSDNTLQLDALAEILQIKLLERLRQQESGVYSENTITNYANFPKAHYNIDIQFTCSAANVDKLVAAALDEIEKIKQNGASPTDIQKFIANETRETQLNLKKNAFWVQHLSMANINGVNPGYILNYTKNFKQVNINSTKLAANTYLNPDNMVKLILLPGKK